MISDYVELLANALRFDRALSRSVRQEVEDHLWEAVAADPTGDRLAAERRAIANFGDPHVIAAQFAAVSLAKQTRSTGGAVIVAIAAVFVAMKGRVAFYAATQWAMSDDMRAVSAIAALIDRYAFWLSVIVAIAGFAYIGSRPVPTAFKPAYRNEIRRCFSVCTAAAGALVVAVVSDGVLTAVRLSATELSVEFLIPILSMAIEVACAGVLVFHIRRVTQRTASAAALLRT
jgi:hypothetical protein